MKRLNENILNILGIGGWIRSIFTLTDEQYMRKCGIDAVQYLKFQRHLIFFVGIITIACICIVLPINFQGMSYRRGSEKGVQGVQLRKNYLRYLTIIEETF